MALPSRIKPFEVTIENSRLPSEWESWKLDLESFFLAQGVEKQSEKRAQLAYLGGPGLQALLRYLPGIDQVPHVTIDPPYYDVAIRCLDQYFEPFRRKTYERHLFHQIVQQPGERFTDFVMRMRKQIARCNYESSVVDELIADRIAQGCISDELRTKLLQKDRSLEEMITLGTSMAESQQQSKKLGRPVVHQEQEIHAVSKRPFRNGQQITDRQSIYQPRNQQNNRFTCYGCGRRGHTHGSMECPAKHTKCAACGKIGHWAKRCYSSGGQKRRFDNPASYPKAKRIRAVSDEFEKGQSKDYVFYAMGGNVFTFKVGGIQVPMTIDSGSDANIITKEIWEQLKEAKVNIMKATTKVDRSLIGYDSKLPMKICGTFSAEIEAGENKTVAKFYVVENGQRCLLGDHTAKNLKVLKVGFDVDAVEVKPKKPFPKIRGVVIEIPIDHDVQPVQQSYRRPPIAWESKIEEKLKSLMEMDIIEPVPGPSPWVSPVVPVMKDSGEIRLCIDMRRANQAVLRESHPLPLVDELLGSVCGAVRFSKIDIKDAYHQVEISERSRPITTFITKQGLYR
ncbi:uncharacterized protein LOC131687739 [Topomyia yanbarensis]|uniref:uncharacterized protein LOC131687739 n=1 Tax=Topomyia yanbarensis TaxID=2498891 RepID=UPI00273AD3B7|nr:uncharacterized protein LOC131687739 [Topomyia yanbarensis]